MAAMHRMWWWPRLKMCYRTINWYVLVPTSDSMTILSMYLMWRSTEIPEHDWKCMGTADLAFGWLSNCIIRPYVPETRRDQWHQRNNDLTVHVVRVGNIDYAAVRLGFPRSALRIQLFIVICSGRVASGTT